MNCSKHTHIAEGLITASCHRTLLMRIRSPPPCPVAVYWVKHRQLIEERKRHTAWLFNLVHVVVVKNGIL